MDLNKLSITELKQAINLGELNISAMHDVHQQDLRNRITLMRMELANRPKTLTNKFGK